MTSGAILGIVLALYSLIPELIKLSDNIVMDYIGYVIFITGIILGIKYIRNKVENGFITYGKALGAGVLISLFTGFIMAFYSYILVKFIDPNLMAKALEVSQQKWMDSGRTDEQIEMMTSISEIFMTPGFAAFSAIFSFTFFGTIVSLILAAFMKKEPDIFANNSLNN
jgi:ethanolamine transporter EutH